MKRSFSWVVKSIPTLGSMKGYITEKIRKEIKSEIGVKHDKKI